MVKTTKSTDAIEKLIEELHRDIYDYERTDTRSQGGLLEDMRQKNFKLKSLLGSLEEELSNEPTRT